VPLPQPADDLRGGEGAAAEVEEVLGPGGDLRAEHLAPDLRDPGRGARERRGGGGAAGRQRPGQGVAVDLAGGADGQLVHDREAGDERGGHAAAQQVLGDLRVVAGVDGEIADQQLIPGPRRADGGGGAHHPGHAQQLVVDLPELDAAPAELDLVVGAAGEEEPRGIVDHAVPGAVGALPAERRHRRVLLGVLGGIEVAGQAHSADDELAGAADGHGHALLVDDGEVPAIQWEPDPHRIGAVEDRAARDHGRLGGAVGVPHLPPRRLQSGRELGRAGLPAHDQQSHLLERRVRPEGDQGRHGRDDRDAVRLEPRADVHARAHERARRGHEACAVRPGQPHLLAARVEGDREPGHDPVAGHDRGVLQEHPRLRLDEGRGIAVRDRDALRLPRGAGGEDDPRVVVRCDLARLEGLPAGTDLGGRDDEVRGDHGRRGRLLEDDPGPLVGVLGVDRDVGGTREEDPEDRDVEVGGARDDAHPDLVPGADALRGEPCGDLAGRLLELGVGERLRAAVHGGGVPGGRDRAAEDRHERARGGGPVAREELGQEGRGRGRHPQMIAHRGDRERSGR
jgi:hypothetical protein